MGVLLILKPILKSPALETWLHEAIIVGSLSLNALVRTHLCPRLKRGREAGAIQSFWVKLNRAGYTDEAQLYRR